MKNILSFAVLLWRKIILHFNRGRWHFFELKSHSYRSQWRKNGFHLFELFSQRHQDNWKMCGENNGEINLHFC